ncbi:hypothetical protein HC725_16215 [Vibrio sp. S17_S38]|uniref:DUF6710 family protein n=1 Tax=Vibrio sp. S17_S38 TaxID=2720229 RepID=UPI001680819A|nr:DUF6710 family protein [Vibrio sp. S17_S38]MBD1574795.1 hypothetical protein [Vibrio sp. S17_S38]
MKKLVSLFFKQRAKTTQSKLDIIIDRFSHLDIDGLEDLQRLIMRPIQSHHMRENVYLLDQHPSKLLDFSPEDFGIKYIPSMECTFIRFFYELVPKIESKNIPLAHLGRDIVLPTPWSPERTSRLLGVLGNKEEWAPDLNHNLQWCYPFNIFLVISGNHSITQGIIRSSGNIKPRYGYDFSILYQYIEFDGYSWIDIKTGQKIGEPRYMELGYIYEIGRIIFEKSAPKLEQKH